MRQPLPLQSYQLASVQSSPERLVNCYIEQMPEGGKGPVKLGRSEGITTFTEVGDGPIVDMQYVPAFDKIFVVSGAQLYSVTDAGVVALIGTVGTGRVSMSHNDASVAVVVSPDMYTWDGATFAQVTDPDFVAVGAQDIQYLDGYLTFTFPDSASFGAFDLGSSSSYDALSFSTEDGDPDFLVGHISDHRQLLLAGTRSMGLWDNTGAAGFPFERAINGYVEIGCANGQTLAKCDNTVMWVASDKTMRRLSGAIPERISQHGVEDQLTTANLASAKSFSFQQRGHLFYNTNFDARASFVYDATTKLFHERKSYGQDNWRASCHTQAWNIDFVGDRLSNKIGYLDKDAKTEFGDPLVMQWTYQPVYVDRRQVTHNTFELVLDSGNGLVVGQGSDPEVMLEYSDNSGKTWRFMPNKKIGRLGEYDIGVRWCGLGSSPNRVYRCSISDPVPVNVVDTQIDITVGRSV